MIAKEIRKQINQSRVPCFTLVEMAWREFAKAIRDPNCSSERFVLCAQAMEAAMAVLKASNEPEGHDIFLVKMIAEKMSEIYDYLQELS
jgi:hypothetical protein